MALTKSDIPELLLPGLKTEFEVAYRNELNHSPIEGLATIIQTTVPSQQYAWLGAVPGMREFVGERVLQGIKGYGVTISDKTFESTIAVDRKAIEDDQLDLIRLRIRDLAGRVAHHRHQMLIETLAGAFTGNGLDGVPFFSGTHPVKGGTFSNTSGNALGANALAEAMASMMTVPDEAGIPLGIVPDTLVVGPNQMWNALELAESAVVVYKGNATDTAASTPYANAFQGRLKVVVSPFLTGASADNWFLLDTKRAIRALILQQRSDVPIEFAALEAGSGSESAFMQDRYLYGVRARYNVGLGLWQCAYGANA